MRRWNVLVVGLGSIGRRHIQILRETIQGDIFVLRQRTKSPQDLPGVTGYFYRWADVLTTSIDFAVICNPTPLHIPTALTLAQNGIPFLMEKPVCASLDGTSRLLRLVQNRRLPVLIGFNWRYHYLYKKIKEIHASRKLGRPLSFYSEMGQFLPDWRAYDYTESSSARKKLGGGVIFDLTHEINLAVDLMGEVRTLTCLKSRVSSLKIDTEDIAEITFSHLNNRISHIHLDYLQKAYTHKIKLIYENGELFWDHSRGTLKLTTKDKIREYAQPKSTTRNDMFKAQLKHWFRVLEGKETPIVSLKQGIYISKLAIAAHASSEQKKWIKIA